MPSADDCFRDTALLLVAHGSSVNEDSGRTALNHAAALRARGLFREVHVAYWRQDPPIAGALDRVAAERVVVVPLCISEGYFTEQVLPEALGLKPPGVATVTRQQRVAGRDVIYCRPVGTHESMTRVLLDRAVEVVARHPFPRVPPEAQTALLIAGHGTERNANSRRAIEAHARRVHAMNRFAEVHSIFIDEPPRIADAYALTQARNLVVVPFFISDGPHPTEDIPVLLGESEAVVRARVAAGLAPWRNPSSRHGRHVWYAACVGTDPRVAEVVVARVREAVHAPER